MSNPEFLKEDLSNFEIVKRPTLKFQSESIETLSDNSSYSQEKKEGKSNQEIEEYQQICRETVPKQGDSESSTSKLKEEDEEDGFKTPTSLDHKVSVPSQCPPAPRKIKPSLKRKAPYYNHCNCRHPLDLSKEVFELLFPTQQVKVRRQEHKN
ncbi:Cyclin-dependent protein kinase inhibitor SMR3, partial [Mucuna pruriens]